jgi:hypothetical protein
MTLNEITSTIRNRVSDGLSGNISNQAYSVKQLEEEVDLERAAYIQKYVDSGRKLNPNYMYQTVDGLRIVCTDLSNNAPCGFTSGDGVPAVKIQPIASTFDDSAIEYFGLMNKQEKFIVYYDTDNIGNHKYRVKTAKRPFIWIDTTQDQNGLMTAYLLNAGKYFNLKYLSVRAIFEHPSRIGGSTAGEKEYPAPGHVQMAIIDSLTEKYVRYFRQMNIPPLPNTQSDPVT